MKPEHFWLLYLDIYEYWYKNEVLSQKSNEKDKLKLLQKYDNMKIHQHYIVVDHFEFHFYDYKSVKRVDVCYIDNNYNVVEKAIIHLNYNKKPTNIKSLSISYENSHFMFLPKKNNIREYTTHYINDYHDFNDMTLDHVQHELNHLWISSSKNQR